MDWPYPPEHLALRDRVDELGREVLGPRAARIDRESAFPRENLDALADESLLGILLPRHYGGLGLDRRAFGLVTAAIARHCSSTALIYAVHVAATEVVFKAGTLGQHERLLRSPGTIGTVAVSEPGAGDDFRACLSQAEETEGGIRLSAEKSFTTAAGHADWYVVETRSPGSNDPDELDAYVVLADQTGVAAAFEPTLGLHGDSSGLLAFRNVFVPEENRLGEHGSARAINDRVLDPLYLLGTSAVWLGIAEAAFEQAVAFAAQRSFRDRSTRSAEQGAKRAQLADAQVRVDALRLTLGWYAEALDAADAGRAAPDDILVRGWELKVLAADVVAEVTDLSLSVCGASGYRDGPVARLLRDGRAAAVMAPTSAHCRELIGRSLCGLPLDAGRPVPRRRRPAAERRGASALRPWQGGS